MITYAFIDASNIIYGARAEGWFIDYKKLFDYLKKKFKVSKIYFYFGKNDKNTKQVKFLQKLKSFGYTLRAKQIKWYGRRMKANCDVDLTMDMLLLKGKYNRAVVLTGDGDFLPLFEHLKKIGKKITIIAFSKRTSQDLKRFAGGDFIGLSNERYLLERKHKKWGGP
jgi:uncharacterized LabA/DUF88 family protein